MPAKCVFASDDSPEISVVIPSLDGSREGNVEELIGQLKGQTVRSIEIILSIGESPNGYARNMGAKIAQGDILVFLDDDVALGHESVLEKLVEPLKAEGSVIGMTGPAQQVPPQANWFQHWCARQIPRSLSPVVKTITDSDMVSHMCLAIPKWLYYEVGEESDWLLAGTDPDLRHRVRQSGYRVVVVPDTWAYHPVPNGPVALIRFAFKKGSYTAWQYRFARELMYECPDGHTDDFKAQTTLGFRVVRKIGRICKEIFLLRLAGIVYDVSYALGYVYGLIRRWS